MKIKEGVILAGLDIHMRTALIAADLVWKRNGQELVVTSGLDGTHSAGSLHYYGRALDFRTNYFTQETVNMAVNELRRRLGKHYDVIQHGTHIHVEYDPKEEGS